jgi:sterol desaturase/sphingolipid hydroxylase (fatty acid hydroxylase superfamily)
MKELHYLAIPALGILFFSMELLFPARKFESSGIHARHDGRNLLLWVFNFGIKFGTFFLVELTVRRIDFFSNLGLLKQFDLPVWIAIPITFLLLDLLMYLWHRLTHESYLLWRLHRIHHTDRNMNYTTMQRYHFIEILIFVLLGAPTVVLLGIELEYYIYYEVTLYVVVTLHHSNVAFPGPLDTVLQLFMVTPNMHRVHHNVNFQDSNANYSSVFSWWDRIFFSYRFKKDMENVRFGQDRFLDDEWQPVNKLLFTIPFLPPTIIKKGRKFVKYGS